MSQQYVHVFLEAPRDSVMVLNDLAISLTNLRKFSHPFIPHLVVTESIDPPITKVLADRGGGLKHLSYIGNNTSQVFLDSLGLTAPVHVVTSTDARIPPTIASPLAFLAALDLAVEQYGEAMPSELKTLLHSFIIAEKRNRGISE